MNFNAVLSENWRRHKPKKAAQQVVQQAQQQTQASPDKKELRPFLRSLICYNPGEIVIRVIYVIGKQRTGKTTLVNAMAHQIQEAKGELVDYRISNDIKDLLSKEWMSIKDKPLLIRFIDDAGRMQNSRKGMEKQQINKIIDMKEIAHIAEDAGFKEGCITIFYGAQNETLVDFQLRSEAEIVILKWLNLSIKEHRELIQGLKNFTDQDREDVEKWITGICLRELWALSRALVIFPTRKWGWYLYEKKDCRIDQQLKHYQDEDGKGETIVSVTKKEAPIPIKALGSDGQTDLKVALDQVIEAMKKEPKWEKKVLCYQMVKDGATQNEVAIKIFNNISLQTTVSQYRKQAQGEIKRRLGAIYENVVTMRLSNEGYSVQHLGGSGEPDIIATKNGKAQAISCKIYEDPRKVVSIDAVQFRPESNFTQKNNSEKFILFFYNLSWEKEIIREVDRDTGTVTLRLSEA